LDHRAIVDVGYKKGICLFILVCFNILLRIYDSSDLYEDILIENYKTHLRVV